MFPTTNPYYYVRRATMASTKALQVATASTDINNYRFNVGSDPLDANGLILIASGDNLDRGN